LNPGASRKEEKCGNILLALAALYGTSHAGETEELMQQVFAQRSAPHEKAEMDMTIVDENGKVRERKAVFLCSRQDPQKQELNKLIRFKFPLELASSAVLTLEGSGDQPDAQWIYLPAAYTSRRIASKNRGDRYMGTDFSYEDIMSVKMGDYAFRSLGKESFQGTVCERVEQISASPGVKAESAYLRLVHLVDPQKAVIMRTDYFDKQGVKCKAYQAKSLHRYGNFFRFDKVEMDDTRLGRKTVIKNLNRDLDSEIPAGLSSIRSMERGD
jgi:hypothetical protein